jgi:hypothetical protein
VTAKSAAEAGTIHSIATAPIIWAVRKKKWLVMDLTFRWDKNSFKNSW